jgi:site-specific DNA-methyltransferase (adenine-specific)
MRTTGLSPSKCDEILKANKLISQTSSRAIHYFNEGQPQVATSEFFDALRPYLPEVPDYIEKMVAERTIESQNFKNREVIATRTFVRNTESWESSGGMLAVGEKEIKETAPATPEAKQWEGWGTALKPAFEPIVVARKPLIGTVAENVLTHGTGGLNIDGSRIGTEQITINNYPVGFDPKGNLNGLTQIGQDYESKTSEGRWPANVILDEYTAELLDEQTGDLKPATSRTARDKHIPMPNNPQLGDLVTHPVYGDTGGASRFFYVAKASKRDRNEGLEDSNTHPTVKPTDLMRYLIKLVTPPGGTVLDPFTGSGSTGKAAILEGFTFIGCELTEEYIPIIQGRLEHAEEQARLAEEKKDEALF